MNRAQRRKLNISVHDSELFDSVLNTKKIINGWKPIPEGTKVKLNYKKITIRSDYSKMSQKYKQWIKLHKDNVFTIKYDAKYKVNPTLLCLKEDTTNPKWLFWEGDLIILKE